MFTKRAGGESDAPVNAPRQSVTCAKGKRRFAALPVLRAGIWKVPARRNLIPRHVRTPQQCSGSAHALAVPLRRGRERAGHKRTRTAGDQREALFSPDRHQVLREERRVLRRDIDLHFHAITNLRSDGAAGTDEERALRDVRGRNHGQPEDVLRRICDAEADTRQRTLLRIAQNVAPEAVLGQTDIPPVGRMHHHERRRKFLRRSDLLDRATDEVDLVPAFDRNQQAGGERRGLRNQTVQVFSDVIAGKKLQLFFEVDVVWHHRPQERHQLSEVFEHLARCRNPVAMVFTRSDTVAKVT